MSKAYYRRHLPHFNAEDRTVFVTWNLKGALPAEATRRMREERDLVGRLCKPTSPAAPSTSNTNPSTDASDVGRLCKPTSPEPTPPAKPNPDKDTLLLEHARRLFRISEDFLDRAEHGPRHLADPELAAVVRDIILEGADRWYDLLAFVVMPNHVHLLLRPKVALDRITMAVKRRTAKEINARMGTTGEPVWQDESFDHFPRDAAACDRIIDYIERNPVAAGLCSRPEDWPNSSAPMRNIWLKGEPWKQAPQSPHRRSAL